jgi:uncharacterized iron-regulated membrane protein
VALVKPMPPSPAARRLWLRVHLWTALILGAVIVLLGISGAALVLKGALVRHDFGAATFDLPPANSVPPASVDRWAENATRSQPGARLVAIAAPGESPIPTQAAVATLALADGGYGFATIDPVSGRALGFFRYGEGSLFTILDLHRHLLLPGAAERLGDVIVALAGIGLIISVVTGLWLWWPRQQSLREVLRFRRGTFLPRSLHMLVALGVAAPLAVIAVTGLALMATDFAAENAPPTAVRAGSMTNASCRPVAGYDDALRIAGGLTRGERFSQIAEHADGSFAVRIRGENGASDVTVDGRCGRIWSVASVSSTTVSLQSIHAGIAFGWPGRLIVLVAGLALPWLYATGLWFWIRRRRPPSAAASL